MPSKRRTSDPISETISSNRNLERSGPTCSPIAVEPTTSANRTVTIRWVPVIATTATSYSDGRPSGHTRSQPLTPLNVSERTNWRWPIRKAISSGRVTMTLMAITLAQSVWC